MVQECRGWKFSRFLRPSIEYRVCDQCRCGQEFEQQQNQPCRQWSLDGCRNQVMQESQLHPIARACACFPDGRLRTVLLEVQ